MPAYLVPVALGPWPLEAIVLADDEQAATAVVVGDDPRVIVRDDEDAQIRLVSWRADVEVAGSRPLYKSWVLGHEGRPPQWQPIGEILPALLSHSTALHEHAIGEVVRHERLLEQLQRQLLSDDRWAAHRLEQVQASLLRAEQERDARAFQVAECRSAFALA